MNRFNFAVFVTIITTLWGLMIGYICWRLFAMISPNFHPLLIAIACASWLAHPIAFTTRFWPDTAWKQFATQLSYAIFGISAVFVVSFIAKDMVLNLITWFIPLDWYASLDVGSSVLLILVSAVVGFFGFQKALRLAEVKRVPVYLPNLSSEWEGLRVVQLTDIHIGSTSDRSVMQQIVDRVNELKPDIVAITGDLVDGSVSDLHHHVEPIFSIKATIGVYFCSGNHDYYSGVEQWSRFLQQGGIEVLSNRHIIHARGEAELVIAGVRDLHAHRIIPQHRCDPVEALRGASKDALRLLLVHQPKSIQLMKEETVDLVLAGHTHGGQFFPFSLLIHLAQPWNAGLYQTKYAQLYVSRGTTHWGPPIRFGADHEITLLELQPARA
ncbi:MAG: metallophosphoesterase [Myxococcota bacterium]|nr:metallophosphoesterase [Myxococcota bacterium]